MTGGGVTVGGESSVSVGGGGTVGLISLEGEINFSQLLGWVETYCWSSALAFKGRGEVSIGTSSTIRDGLGCTVGERGGTRQGGTAKGEDGGGTVWIGDMVGVVMGVGAGGAVEIGLREGEGSGDRTGGRMNEADGMDVRTVSTVVWRLSSAIIRRG